MLNRLLAETEAELAQLDIRRAELLTQITQLQQKKSSFLQGQDTPQPPAKLSLVTNQSPQEVKIADFFHFRGRADTLEGTIKIL